MITTSRRVLAVGRVLRSLLAVALVASATGCVTVAEFRKLERQVVELRRSGPSGQQRGQLADLSAENDELRSALRDLRGRIDVVEKTAADALADARTARQQLAAGSAPAAVVPVDRTPPDASQSAQPASAELLAYRQAYSSWRDEAADDCIEQFRSFLKTYPSSPYADDAAFWMADCHFKQGDFKNAVLRFDDVVRNYPSGNKAPDALYRQGESLLKLGPGYHDAAKRAFERVLKEYPESARAGEARRRLAATG